MPFPRTTPPLYFPRTTPPLYLVSRTMSQTKPCSGSNGSGPGSSCLTNTALVSTTFRPPVANLLLLPSFPGNYPCKGMFTL